MKRRLRILGTVILVEAAVLLGLCLYANWYIEKAARGVLDA